MNVDPCGSGSTALKYRLIFNPVPVGTYSILRIEVVVAPILVPAESPPARTAATALQHRERE